uniref:Uncharacterized protein n=1 Tax=Arion vulgaris TaxID=1028688 RepID=A0A0B7AKK0_9EUPU
MVAYTIQEDRLDNTLESVLVVLGLINAYQARAVVMDSVMTCGTPMCASATDQTTVVSVKMFTSQLHLVYTKELLRHTPTFLEISITGASHSLSSRHNKMVSLFTLEIEISKQQFLKDLLLSEFI